VLSSELRKVPHVQNSLLIGAFGKLVLIRMGAKESDKGGDSVLPFTASLMKTAGNLEKTRQYMVFPCFSRQKRETVGFSIRKGTSPFHKSCHP
jgi:hypothetical protein